MFLHITANVVLNRYGNSTVRVLESDSSTTFASASLCPNKRNQYGIIWTCLTTIIVCTWVSIHPNIPPPHKGYLGVLWRRIKLMLWSLIVPELILGWAFRQWIAAREIEKEYQGWTKLHGHFLVMGGFNLVNQFSHPDVIGSPSTDMPRIPELPPVPQTEEEKKDYGIAMERLLESIEAVKQHTYSMLLRHKPDVDNPSIEITNQDLDHYRRYELAPHWQLRSNISHLKKSSGILSLRRFKDLVHESKIAFPFITAAEICDKSKGDLLSKAIAILQTSWFIVQCIGRYKQGLAITELELLTLALASLNGLIYFFWWHKPVGVSVPMTVYLKGSEPLINTRNDDRHQSLVATLFGKDFEEFIFSMNVKEHLESLGSKTSSSIASFFQARRDEIPEHSLANLLFLWFLRHPFHWFLYTPISIVVKSLYAIINTDTMDPGVTHVPTFYATGFDWQKEMILTYFVLPFIAVVFGGLHCLGWNFFFPTKVERILWRSASVFITAIPLVIVFAVQLKDANRNRDDRHAVHLASALLSLYVLARVALLMEAVVTLRMQPESAYLEVDWSKFLPHIS